MGGRLRDRITIVIGAGCIGPGWGNGRAIAVRFAEEGGLLEGLVALGRKPSSA